jgi:hypothetical protein
MRVRKDRQKFSVASLLLCLVVAFAVSPPESFCRTAAGQRNRLARTVRLDDHDHDHVVEASHTTFEAGDSNDGGNGLHFAILPARQLISFAGGPPGEVLVDPASRPFTPVVARLRGRSPPAV